MQLMPEIQRDKIYGCWLGKSLGGALGGPPTGKTDFLDLPLRHPGVAVRSLYLDIQLAWLNLLETEGVEISAQKMADAWLDYLDLPFDEFGVALANLRMGLRPPVSGFYNNWFKDAMGAPARAEIWACLCPGVPAAAAYYALQDAQVDHWGEGVYGEIFLAALASQAFVGDDIGDMVGKALDFIPTASRVHRAAMTVVRAYADGLSLADSRREVIAHFGHDNYTDAPQNVAFIVLGLLHGQGDFLKSMIFAADCGYDAAANAGAAGAVCGIIAGGKSVLAGLPGSVDERIVPGSGVRMGAVPADLPELADRVSALASQAAAGIALPKLMGPFALTRIPPFESPLRIACHYGQIPVDAGDSQPLLTEAAQEVVFEGAFFDVEDLLAEEDAMLVLETCIDLDAPRRLRFVPHSTGPVAVWVDNRKIIQWDDSLPLLPSTHRSLCGDSRLNWEMLELAEGVHEITIRIKHPANGRRLEFAWLAVDEEQQWITDLRYVLKP